MKNHYLNLIFLDSLAICFCLFLLFIFSIDDVAFVLCLFFLQFFANCFLFDLYHYRKLFKKNVK